MAFVGGIESNPTIPDATRIAVVESNECKVRFDGTAYIEQGQTASEANLVGSTQDRPIQFREDQNWGGERDTSSKKEL